MATPISTDEIKLRNQIVKFSVGTLFKIYTHKTYKPDPTDPTDKKQIINVDNEALIRKEMIEMGKSRNYISSTSNDLSLVPPPLVHDLLVKSIDKLKAAKTIVIPS